MLYEFMEPHPIKAGTLGDKTLYHPCCDCEAGLVENAETVIRGMLADDRQQAVVINKGTAEHPKWLLGYFCGPCFEARCERARREAWGERADSSG